MLKLDIEDQQFISQFNVIRVSNKRDVLKAADLLSKLDIKVFKDEESKSKFVETGDNVNNNYLIKDLDGWRIQSYYLGDAIGTDALELKINELMEKRLLNYRYINKNPSLNPFSQSKKEKYDKIYKTLHVKAFMEATNNDLDMLFKYLHSVHDEIRLGNVEAGEFIKDEFGDDFFFRRESIINEGYARNNKKLHG